MDSEFNLGNGAGLVARLNHRFFKGTVLEKNYVSSVDPGGRCFPCSHHRVRRTEEDGEHTDPFLRVCSRSASLFPVSIEFGTRMAHSRQAGLSLLNSRFALTTPCLPRRQPHLFYPSYTISGFLTQVFVVGFGHAAPAHSSNSLGLLVWTYPPLPFLISTLRVRYVDSQPHRYLLNDKFPVLVCPWCGPRLKSFSTYSPEHPAYTCH